MDFIIYISIVILLVYLSGQDKRSKTSGYQLFWFLIIAAMLSLPVALSTGGTDKSRYVTMYRDITSLSDIFNVDIIRNGSWEYGFSLLCYISNLLGLDSKGFLFFIAFIINFLLLLAFNKFPLPYFAVLCFCVSGYSQENNLIRQMLAAAVFLHALVVLTKEKYLLYFLLIFVASLFHKSAIYLVVLAIVPFLKLIEKKVFGYICYVLWGISLLVFFKIVNVDFLNLVFLLSDESSYAMYLTDENTMGVAQVSVVEFISINLLFLLSLFNKPKYDIYFLIMLLAVCGMNIRDSLPNMGRFFFYFSIIIPVYVTMTMTNVSDSHFKMKYSLFTIASILYFVVYQFLFISLRGGHELFD